MAANKFYFWYFPCIFGGSEFWINSVKNGEYGVGSVYGSIITYKCNEGYKLKDESSKVRKCQTDGTWSGK